MKQYIHKGSCCYVLREHGMAIKKKKIICIPYIYIHE